MKLNVQFNEQQTAAIVQLAAGMKKSKAKVLKTALALLEVCLREESAGNRIAVIRDERIVKDLIILV